MSYTLSELLQDAYMELGQLRRGQASGGSAGTLVDAAELAGQREDDWKGGTVFLAAGGAPPAGEFARVAGFAASSGTLTLAASFSEPMEAGMAYALASAQYPLATMIELANSALRGLGAVPQVDEDVLPSSNNTLAWARRRPLRIDYLAVPGSAQATRGVPCTIGILSRLRLARPAWCCLPTRYLRGGRCACGTWRPTRAWRRTMMCWPKPLRPSWPWRPWPSAPCAGSVPAVAVIASWAFFGKRPPRSCRPLAVASPSGGRNAPLACCICGGRRECARVCWRQCCKP
ncbi:MAG TPA: hypothetical protein PLC52_04895 [Anaerolineales bacterium]|nr:hypothetical protein [Anaerolineales bacterium]HRQ92187.1 hypothetical protein [Anaerolineales bacterium]